MIPFARWVEILPGFRPSDKIYEPDAPKAVPELEPLPSLWDDEREGQQGAA